MHRIHALLLLPLTALAAAACSGTPASPVLAGCTAGASEACICAGSSQPGIQVCGTGGVFTACICAPGSTSTDAGMDVKVTGRDSGGSDANRNDATHVNPPDAHGADVVVVPFDGGGACVTGEGECNGNTPLSCIAGQWVSSAACAGSTPDCQGGVCVCPNTICGNECIDTTSDPAHCGDCSSACPYTCSASVCGPLEVESNTGALGFGIATDGTDVYWLSGETAATLEACPASGCVSTPETIASNISPLGQFGNMLAVSTTSIYWVNGTSVMVAPLSGTTSAIFATTAGPQQLVADSTNVYWTDSAGFVYECALGASCASPEVLVNLSNDAGTAASPQQIAVDTSNVYWSDSAGNISSAPLHGGATVLLTASATPYDLAALGGTVYWTGATGVFHCAGGAACTPTPYYSETISAFGNLAVDATTLYWTTGNSPGAVRKCALGATCSAPLTVVDNVDTPSYIVVDSVHSYWLQGMTVGTVYEYSK